MLATAKEATVNS